MGGRRSMGRASLSGCCPIIYLIGQRGAGFRGCGVEVRRGVGNGLRVGEGKKANRTDMVGVMGVAATISGETVV